MLEDVARFASLIISIALSASSFGCDHGSTESPAPPDTHPSQSPFDGSRAGEERDVLGVALVWCPAGTFTFGSPPDEPERRPGETQRTVTLTNGFWIAKYEATQGLWKS